LKIKTELTKEKNRILATIPITAGYAAKKEIMTSMCYFPGSTISTTYIAVFYKLF